jgi:hypothetical protein
MLYQTFIFAVLFIILSILTPAFAEPPVCAAEEQSCQMYSCVEQHFQCGKKGYLTKFGLKNCEKYLENQDFSSERLQQWYPKVRYCLQTRLADIADQTADTPKACKDLERLAFASHVDCYIETGFCDLSFLDKFAVAAVAGTALFNPESIKTEQAVSAACAQIHK